MIPRGGGGDRGGDVGRRLRGEEERKGEEGADVWARFARERGAAGARGRAVRGRKGEGAVGWAGELRRARVGRLGHVGSLGCGEKEGERRKERAGGKKRKRPGGLSWAGAGVKGRSRAGPPEEKKLGWPGLGFGLGFFSFLFLNQSKLNLFEFKFEFEFKPHSTKNKLCTSMNAQTSST